MLQIVIRLVYLFFVCNVVTGCMLQVQEEKSAPEEKNSTMKLPYYDEAVIAAKRGDVDKAIDLFKKAALATPDFANIYTSLGLQYLQKGDLDQAEDAFDKAIGLDAGNYVAYNHLGAIMRKRGEFSTAETMYLTAIKLNPDYANACLNIAVLYDIYLYNHEQALLYYKKYQALSGGEDKLVSKWIVDLERQMVNKKAE